MLVTEVVMRYAMLVLLLAMPIEACAINLSQAILIANNEVSKLGLNPADLEVKVDKDNEVWNAVMAELERSHYEPAQREFEEYSRKTRCKDFWVITYSVKVPDGHILFDGGPTVIVEKSTGIPLLVLTGE